MPSSGRLLRGIAEFAADGILRAGADCEDAAQHGVEIRPVCVNASRWDCTLEEIEGSRLCAVRLGMRMVKGLSTADAARIVAARADETFVSADDLWRRSGVPTAALVKLAEADAFLPSLQLQRRDALWAIKGLRDEPLELWAAAAEREARLVAEMQEPSVALPSMRAGHEVVEDYAHTGLTSASTRSPSSAKTFARRAWSHAPRRWPSATAAG